MQFPSHIRQNVQHTARKGVTKFSSRDESLRVSNCDKTLPEVDGPMAHTKASSPSATAGSPPWPRPDAPRRAE